ncbi:type I phosphomannose isomerase catalytic subunit [Planctomicrobium sp. SH661]|uniref:type I phosphomannose isomerase catalytic subunit n=1 Tax=Planctomicrobium sp. SH661 TaxID=3448124 RepID=UPI003F5CAC3C
MQRPPNQCVKPLRFLPIVKYALWGGRRLELDLLKPAGGRADAAESWEVCDLPGNVSVVESGLHAGKSLRELMQESAGDLLGRHQGCQQFPLLIKFLDANQQLSVQVHPKDSTRMPDGTLRLGKAEAWIVLQADPGNRVYVGLQPGVTEQQLSDAVKAGDFTECLHSYEARQGDCIYLESGTVHALGGGLLVAEIQQPSDIAYRFYDWGRVDAEGQSRELHPEQGMAAVNFEIGPVNPVVPRVLPGRARSELLVDCPHFVIHRHRGGESLDLPDDNAMHVFMVLDGLVRQAGCELRRGETVVIPAARTASSWELSDDAILLDTHLPY